MGRNVCVFVLGEDIQLLGEEDEALTGSILSLPEEESVRKDFQLREAGSLESEEESLSARVSHVRTAEVLFPGSPRRKQRKGSGQGEVSHQTAWMEGLESVPGSHSGA